FPRLTRGFFYYKSGTGTAALDGGVRFRITLERDPALFPLGHDLALPSGLPWEVSLPQIACAKKYEAVRMHLLYAQLATTEQVSRCRTLWGRKPIHPNLTLFSLGSLFYADFSHSLKLTVVGETKLHQVQFNSLFAAYAQGKTYFPWRGRWLGIIRSGTALARFEPSTLLEHAGRRVLHLRIVRLLEPVEFTPYMQHP
ncbi:hypothetical protein C8R43DRAFT_829148, partial [Mycena crocata]